VTPVGRAQIFGSIHVPTQSCIFNNGDTKSESLGFIGMSFGGAWSVGELESDSGRDRDDIGAIGMTIGDDDNDLLLGRNGESVEVHGVGEISVGDDHPVEAELGEFGDSVSDRAIESVSRLPEYDCADRPGPLCDVVVITHHMHWVGTGGVHNGRGHDTSELTAFL
jgi:hypothetical protein